MISVKTLPKRFYNQIKLSYFKNNNRIKTAIKMKRNFY